MAWYDSVQDWASDNPLLAWLAFFVIILFLFCLCVCVVRNGAKPQPTLNSVVTPTAAGFRTSAAALRASLDRLETPISNNNNSNSKVLGKMAGWTAIADGKTGRVYYWNKLQNKTLWKKPEEFTVQMPLSIELESVVSGGKNGNNNAADKAKRESNAAGVAVVAASSSKVNLALNQEELHHLSNGTTTMTRRQPLECIEEEDTPRMEEEEGAKEPKTTVLNPLLNREEDEEGRKAGLGLGRRYGGWSPVWDSRKEKYYYWNENLKKTVWKVRTI